MKKPHSLYWMLTAAAALGALAAILLSPSSAEKAWLLGFSKQRLALAAIPLSGLLLSLGMLALPRLAPRHYQRLGALALRVVEPGAALTASLSAWAALLTLAAFLFFRLAVAPHLALLTLTHGNFLPRLAAYLERLWPVILFAAACLAVWSLFAARALHIPFYKNPSLLIASFAAVVSVFATLFTWLVFSFQLNTFYLIPGYYWPILFKPNFLRHAAAFAVVLGVVLALGLSIRRWPRAALLHIALSGLLFLGLQFLIGSFEGRGLASLNERFFLSYHRIYLEEACSAGIPAREAVVRYEELFPSMFLQTKPPGVLWLSFQIKALANSPALAPLLERFANYFTLSETLPRMDSSACRRSMALVSLTFPFLSASLVWVIYAFSQRLFRGKAFENLAAYSALFSVLAPNLIMLSLFLDQALYPPLFLLMAGAVLLAVREESWAGCFAIGALLYGVIFLSFSMLPLLAVPVFYFAAAQWQKNKPAQLWPAFKTTLLPMGLGGLLSMVLFRLFWRYDIFTRYQRMMQTRIEGDFYTRLGLSAAGDATLLEKLRQTWDAAVLNNVEMGIAIGFPVFIFFVFVGARSLLRVIRRQPGEAEPINASLFLAYAALIALRVVLGEVARLWMFWIPVMALLAVQAFLPLFRRSRWALAALLALQVITVFLTYQYQDYLMPQMLP